MDDFRKVSMKSGYSPMPPRTRSERTGSRSRSSRSGGPRGTGGRGPQKQGWQRFFNWKWMVLVLLTSLLIMVGGCTAVMMTGETLDLEKAKDPTKMPTNSKLLDSDNKVVAVFGNEYREWVNIEDIKKKNPELLTAFVKVEDRRFYEHNGIDYEGLGRAIIKNIIAMGNAQGASTLTQQVCKNIVLGDFNKTYTRKIREIGCALNLEKELGEKRKDKILEAYLNFIDFGGVNGIKLASEVYFGKDPTKKKLEIEEIALLAGMPKAPYKYNPLKNPEAAKERRDVVLTQVLPVDDVIPPIVDKQTAEERAKKPVNACPKTKCWNKLLKAGKYDHYKAFVQEELKRDYGINPEKLGKSGYVIKTALNQQAQTAVEKALQDKSLFVNKGQYMKDADASIVMLNPKNGMIVAVGNGRQYQPGYQKRALLPVQPGSTIKPLTVYAPAVNDHDYNEYSIVKDIPVDFAGDWNPSNYGGMPPQGNIPMLTMVKKSLNKSTVRLLHEVVTLNSAYDYAQKLGLNLKEADRTSYAALALGGVNGGVNTKQMAQAYAVFANGGKYYQARTIVSVTQNGEVVEPKNPDKYKQPKQVFSEKTAWYMTRMMKHVIADDDGTGHNARLKDGRDVAGKSGTIQGEKAAWFVGYTPDLVAAVNVMYPIQGAEIVKVTGGSVPAKIFSYVMSEAHQGIPPHSFKKPPGVEEPKRPFELQAPHLSYESHPDGVLLKWQQQPEQVTYQVFRAEGGNFVKVADLPAGSTSWKDPSALPPQDDGFDLGDLFGGGGEKKKVYRYKVVAIDTQATDPANKEKSSEITVELKSGKKEEKPKFDKNNDGIDDRQQDTDGDGVNDHEDKFPNDPTRTGKEQDGGGGNGDHGDGGPGRGDGDNGDGNNGNGNGNTGGWPF
ncbi:hypothetical protein ADL26_14735 [Thermoactinomyces vulgaris]|nr:hypothetical protein ADL26_14735 [Thermoactinomyces vulgaris]